MDIQFFKVAGIHYCTASIKAEGKKEFYIAAAQYRNEAWDKIWDRIKKDFKSLFKANR